MKRSQQRLLAVLADEPFYTFAIPIKTEEYEPDTVNGLSCRLEFTYTAKYPDESLLISIEEQENFEEGSDEKLKEHLIEQMNENLGMVMVFTLVSAAQEWLNVQWDKIKLNREESAAKKLKEEEEAERVRRYKFKIHETNIATLAVISEKVRGNSSHGGNIFMLERKVRRRNGIHKTKRNS